MVYLPGGEFVMGNDRGNPDEAPAHKVRVSPFLMDKFEVTQEMFKQAQLPNPSHWQENPQKPVERVRWIDAKRYCNERSLLEDLKPCYNEKTVDWDCDYQANGYRLPTEAEWEYACRAGTDGESTISDRQTSSGNTPGFQITRIRRPTAWARRSRMAFGIYDLYGNVSEWCEDVYSPTYYKESPAADPLGPASSGERCEAGHPRRELEIQLRTSAARPPGRASGLATRTRAFRPTIAASAACAALRRKNSRS